MFIEGVRVKGVQSTNGSDNVLVAAVPVTGKNVAHVGVPAFAVEMCCCWSWGLGSCGGRCLLLLLRLLLAVMMIMTIIYEYHDGDDDGDDDYD